MNTPTKPTKRGVKAALTSLGYDRFPAPIAAVQAADTFTNEDQAFAEYLIWDTDFGGAWNDAEQINLHLE